MATNVKVVGTDLRQVTVKVNPGTYLTEVLENACAKLKVTSDKFLLKHKQRQLDLSQTFRTSGLIPGARLELVVRSNTPTAINVAIQLPSPESTLFPPHGRITEKLPSDFTVWQVLRQFESGKASAGKNLNITVRGVAQTSNGAGTGSGQLYYETPNVQLENRTLATFNDFQKTLSQLGYNSGGVLMRLSFEKTGQTLADAMTEMGQHFKMEEMENAPGQTGESASIEEPANTTDPSAMDSLPIDTAHGVAASGPVTGAGADDVTVTGQPDTAATGDAMDVDEPVTSGGRPVTIFSAPTSSTPAASLRSDSEEAFMPDISHAKAHQRLLKSLGENKRLPSDQELQERAAAEAAKVAAVKLFKVKVRFPDNTSAEWSFGPDDTGATLYAEVRNLMANDTAPFRLALPPGKVTIKDDSSDASKLVQGYRLSANTLVNFLWEDAVPADVRQQPFLKGSLNDRAREVVVPEVREVDVKDEAGPSIPTSAPKPRNEGSGSGVKKPKWLKGLGKK
ncbi:Uu.00g045500.m01.CDS01 [Anthostomella pinea]|uniref:Uu.00g045500.m01.CDS01 n=1 Tax=Anthostomella pinea TaxID=933095 RepID=A0AAI8VBP5_9PEZI|nr:Uu.00g045500.m01.CDS01 [Anthostomella pinea]